MSVENTKKSRTARRIAATALSIPLLLIILVLTTTWLINRAPVQNRVRQGVEQRTGNMVTFRSLRLSLLPRPRLALYQVRVNVAGSMDITIPRARIYPEVLPLLTGRVRIAKVKLDDPALSMDLKEEPEAAPEEPRALFEETRSDIETAATSIESVGPAFVAEVNRGTIVLRKGGSEIIRADEIAGSLALIPGGFEIGVTAKGLHLGPVSLRGAIFTRKSGIAVRDLYLAGGRSSLSGVTASFHWRRSPYLRIESGGAIIYLEDLFERRQRLGRLGDKLRDVQGMKGVVRIAEMTFTGPLLHEERWEMNAAGSLEGIEVQSALVPGPVRIRTGSFKATTKTLTLQNLDADFLDSSITTGLKLAGSVHGMSSMDLSLRGRIGHDSIVWAAHTLHPPPDLIPRAALSLESLRFTWEKGPVYTVQGAATIQNGPRVSVDLRQSPHALDIKRLVVEDGKDKASLALRKRSEQMEITYQGKVSEDTFNRIFERSSGHHGWIRGDLRANILLDKPGESTARGELEGGDLSYGPGNGVAVTARQIKLGVDEKVLTLKEGSFLYGDHPFDLTGTVTVSEGGFRFDANLAAESLSLAMLQQAFSRNKNESPKAGAAPAVPVQGIINLAAKDFSIDKFRFSPVKARISVDQRGSVGIQVIESKLCGISVPGRIEILHSGVQLDLNPAVIDQPLEPALDCFSTNRRVTGTYSFLGGLHSRGNNEELLRSLEGWASFSAKDGRFYTNPLLSRIFAFLNLTELLRGKLPDMGRDGFAYKSVRIKGDIKNGRLALKEAIIEGETLNLVADGEIDIAAGKLDMTVLVAPFKTIEAILGKIPLLKSVLANKLITVPVRVSGDLNNPNIILLDPKAVGGHVLDIMEGILDLPFKVVDPLFRGGKTD